MIIINKKDIGKEKSRKSFKGGIQFKINVQAFLLMVIKIITTP